MIQNNNKPLSPGVCAERVETFKKKYVPEEPLRLKKIVWIAFFVSLILLYIF